LLRYQEIHPSEKVFRETYEQNINLLADFLANQNPTLKQKPEESRRQAVALLPLYLGTMASSILGANNDGLRQAWQQAASDIVHHKIE
jgi:hypothetical protein